METAGSQQTKRRASGDPRGSGASTASKGSHASVSQGSSIDTPQGAGSRSGAGPESGEGVEEDLDSAEYELRKRLPRRLPRRANDVYVTRKTNFKAQLARCKRLLERGEPELFIHGLGAAVDRAVNLALQLQALGSLDLAANTTTVELIDDLEPLDDRLEPLTQSRSVSAIHIRVFSRTAVAGSASGLI